MKNPDKIIQTLLGWLVMMALAAVGALLYWLT